MGKMFKCNDNFTMICHSKYIKSIKTTDLLAQIKAINDI